MIAITTTRNDFILLVNEGFECSTENDTHVIRVTAICNIDDDDDEDGVIEEVDKQCKL